LKEYHDDNVSYIAISDIENALNFLNSPVFYDVPLLPFKIVIITI